MHGTFFSKKFQLVTPPKFTRASDCLADGMATDPSSRHCEQEGKQGWYCLTEFILNASNHFDDMKLLFIRIFASGLLQTKGFAE